MDPVQELVAKDEVREAVHALFAATDARDWPRVRACFGPMVQLDIGQGPAARVPARDIVAAWEKELAPLEALHHQVGNLDVKVLGPEARATCYGIAYHYLPNKTGRNTRVFVGTYDLHLFRLQGAWRVDEFRFAMKFVDGNAELEKAG